MLEYKNLVKKFGERTVLDRINLKINKGEIAFILGTSGTGKSVFLKTTVGLFVVDEGEIFFENRKISALDENGFRAVRQNCGMVFQQPALFDSLTIFDNVAFGLRRKGPISVKDLEFQVKEALNLVHLEGIESNYPAEISYGMQKRVSLARTIALKPKVLLFDEPTTGLDPVTTTAINQLIQDLSRKMETTSVVVSHDMQCAFAIADRIVVLDQGKIIANGSRDEIKQSNQTLIKDFLKEVAIA